MAKRRVSDGNKSYRKALIPFGELVMFMPIEKPKDKGEVRSRYGAFLVSCTLALAVFTLICHPFS